MRTSLAVLAAAGMLTILSGCGTSSGEDDAAETTTTEAAPIEVEAWADSFCGSFGTWLDAIEAASSGVADEVVPGDIASAKTAISNLFGTASTATEGLIAELEDGGAPDIDDGDQLVDDLIAKFDAFNEAAQAAQADTEALANEDIASFQGAADELTTRFQDEVNTVADSFGEIDTDYPSPELNAALTASCDF